VYDASGKFPSGILQGNTLLMGHAHSCYEIQVEPSKNVGHEFDGRFCSLQLIPEKSKSTSQTKGNKSNILSSEGVEPKLIPSTY